MKDAHRSHPTIETFNPFAVPYQAKVIREIDTFDYKTNGMLEILLSGSVGSAKSILGAHMAVRHCLMYPGARFALCRRALPDLKSTIFQTILEHLECDALVEGRDYWVNQTRARVLFSNGSEIIPLYWADKRYKRARSVELSAALFEELTESSNEEEQAFHEIKARVGRRHHVPERFLMALTNPDSPRHWAYKYFILNQGLTRRVFYSRTEDNPFLPKTYIEQLKRDLDPKQARRMIYGEWIEIEEERVYYAYGTENYHPDLEYRPNGNPIGIAFDFNIAAGKPMSAAIGQYDRVRDIFHFYGEVIVAGARTLDLLEEIAGRGILNHPGGVKIYGDATGKARSTNSIHSDYDVIEKFMANHRTPHGMRLSYEMCVPQSNPPVRERHNIVNGYCHSAAGDRRLHVYKGCATIDEGMRLTALKKGSAYVEDDSKAYQHVTTAMGYFIVYESRRKSFKPGGNIPR